MSREPETIDAVELPPDPDEMNEDRAMWAGSCIQRMADMTGCEPGQEALGDLLCNLFHWCDRNGISNEELIAIFHCRYKLYQQETMPFPEEERTVKSPGEQPDGEWQDNLGESPDY